MSDLHYCPRCSQKWAQGERWCWWCQLDSEKVTGCCTECGAPKDRGNPVEFKKVFKQIMCGIR